MENFDFDFDSMFLDEKKDDLSKEESSFLDDADFSFSEIEDENSKQSDNKNQEIEEPEEHKRNSSDFQADMELLLLTAQASMIIEGMKSYTKKEFAPDKIQIYSEAINGINLYLKLIMRSAEARQKLKTLCVTDIDCKEVDKIAKNLYFNVHREQPKTDDDMIASYKLFKNLFVRAYRRTSINISTTSINKYFMNSGKPDDQKIYQLLQTSDKFLFNDISIYQQDLEFAQNLISKIRPKDIQDKFLIKNLNSFIIRSSNFLSVFFNLSGNSNNARYYQKIYDNQTKYFFVK